MTKGKSPTSPLCKGGGFERKGEVTLTLPSPSRGRGDDGDKAGSGSPEFL